MPPLPTPQPPSSGNFGAYDSKLVTSSLAPHAGEPSPITSGFPGINHHTSSTSSTPLLSHSNDSRLLTSNSSSHSHSHGIHHKPSLIGQALQNSAASASLVLAGARERHNSNHHHLSYNKEGNHGHGHGHVIQVEPNSHPSHPSSPWSVLTLQILPVFNGMPLPQPVEELNKLATSHITQTRTRSPRSYLSLLSSDLQELISTGMLTLKAKLDTVVEQTMSSNGSSSNLRLMVRSNSGMGQGMGAGTGGGVGAGQGGSKLIGRLAESWWFSFGIIPTVQGIFLPLSLLMNDPSHQSTITSNITITTNVRQLLLSGFLLHILLPLLPRIQSIFQSTLESLQPLSNSRSRSSPTNSRASNVTPETSSSFDPLPTPDQLARIQHMCLILSTQAKTSNFTSAGGSSGIKVNIPPSRNQSYLEGNETSRKHPNAEDALNKKQVEDLLKIVMRIRNGGKPMYLPVLGQGDVGQNGRSRNPLPNRGGGGGGGHHGMGRGKETTAWTTRSRPIPSDQPHQMEWRRGPQTTDDLEDESSEGFQWDLERPQSRGLQTTRPRGISTGESSLGTTDIGDREALEDEDDEDESDSEPQHNRDQDYTRGDQRLYSSSSSIRPTIDTNDSFQRTGGEMGMMGTPLEEYRSQASSLATPTATLTARNRGDQTIRGR